ncbi:FapA family protein [Campylobacter sp. 19-13652]|uniref:FapA family protein n=1 Tax=Campylobacter sp. 19-13652 TaxID=2840180 RepID=UPI001C7484E0|nr:FapA family protein [Campylobacter sp. 19-13652]BCX79470.1 hypothetical protein LBC_09320 [Campylobacter sp. 19-13652]
MSTQSRFSAIEVITTNPYEELKRLSKESNISAEFIDFNILEIFTTYTNSQNENPVSLSEDELGVFDDLAFYLDESLAITQSYRVEFYDIRDESAHALPRIAIGVNKGLTKVIATIFKSSEVKYEKEYEKLLYEYICKQLLRAKILIGIRIGELKEELKKIASIIRIKELLDKDIKLTITRGIEARLPVDATTVYVYKEKLQKENEEGKVNHASRGFLLGVVKDEVIIEQHKSESGRAGRNVRGEYISVPVANEDGTGEISFNEENIERIEGERGVKFIAKKPGFVSDEKGFFDIKDQLEIDEINFKSTGSVETSIDANVSLIIKEDDVIKDAIGTGVIVEAAEVDVRGSVGANAVINANIVHIGGQTHAKAKITAQKAKIAVHIGYVDADEVEIERLENGTVVANRVKVGQVVGGSITAQHIEINTLGSNCTLTASAYIGVKTLKGNNNKFIIDGSKMKEQRDDIQGHLEKLELAKEAIVKIPKKLEARRIVIEENRGSIYKIKAKIEELKKAKIAPHVTFLKKLKEYQALVDEYNEMLADYRYKKGEIERIKSELDVMQNGIFAAKIVNRSRWNELNEVWFVLVDPPQTIKYITKQNEMARIMRLKRISTEAGDEYEVVKSNDISELNKENE